MHARKYPAVIAAAAVLVSCGGGARYVDISQNAPIAVVSFSLDKSIVEEEKEKDNGPGLLQNKEKYYEHHQQAIDGLWRDFVEQYGDVVIGSDVIDPQTVLSNEQYKEATKHVAKMIMGQDVASGSNVIVPTGGPNYVSSYNKQVLDQVAALLNAKLLMCIEYTGSYKMSTGLRIGGLGGGAAKMVLSAKVDLYEPGKGVVLSGAFSAPSDESFAMVNGILLSENYEKGFCSAQKKLLPEMKAFFSDQQAKAKAAAQNANK